MLFDSWIVLSILFECFEWSIRYVHSKWWICRAPIRWHCALLSAFYGWDLELWTAARLRAQGEIRFCFFFGFSVRFASICFVDKHRPSRDNHSIEHFSDHAVNANGDSTWRCSPGKGNSIRYHATVRARFVFHLTRFTCVCVCVCARVAMRHAPINEDYALAWLRASRAKPHWVVQCTHNTSIRTTFFISIESTFVHILFCFIRLFHTQQCTHTLTHTHSATGMHSVRRTCINAAAAAQNFRSDDDVTSPNHSIK